MRVLIKNVLEVEGPMHIPLGEWEPVCNDTKTKDAPSRTDGWYDADAGDLPNHWYCGNCLRALARLLDRIHDVGTSGRAVADGGEHPSSDDHRVTIEPVDSDDEGVEQAFLAEERFVIDGEIVIRETKFSVNEDGSSTVLQRVQGCSDQLTLHGDLLDKIAEVRSQ